MSEFRTVIEKPKAGFDINLKTKTLTQGSCFSDVLGKYLVENKIGCLANPFGNVYNIQSIWDILRGLEAEIDEKFIVEQDGVCLHYFYHSDLRAFSKEELISEIKKINAKVLDFLKNADVIILTFGTSWVYEHIENQAIVSNCHKQNAKFFEKKILSEKEQLDIFENIYNYLKSLNSQLKIVLTVSPVRHTKDSLTLNSVSKSILRLLCHEIVEKFTDTSYFPSYEIMMDDLRDYRFYKPDLIHPNEVAEGYILDVFSEAYFEESLQVFIKEWKKIKLALNHRPFNPNTAQHIQFLKNLLAKLQKFENQIDVSAEVKQIEVQLKETF